MISIHPSYEGNIHIALLDIYVIAQFQSTPLTRGTSWPAVLQSSLLYFNPPLLRGEHHHQGLEDVDGTLEISIHPSYEGNIGNPVQKDRLSSAIFRAKQIIAELLS